MIQTNCVSLVSVFRYYRGTHGVIVVYDVTSAESFVNVKRWLHEINQNCDDVCRILGECASVHSLQWSRFSCLRTHLTGSVKTHSLLYLESTQSRALTSAIFSVSVGNKNDDPNSKVVETTDAQKFAEQMGISLFETSAKENINVEEVNVCLSEHLQTDTFVWSCSWDMSGMWSSSTGCLN